MGLNNYVIRDAVESDTDGLKRLFDYIFGESMCGGHAVDYVTGRYMVATTLKGEIVAATGIVPPLRSDFNGFEVSWTATLPEHRHNGLIIEMLKQCIDKMVFCQMDVYCRCWRLPESEKINLYHVLTTLGFEEVMRDLSTMQSPYTVDCNDCPHRETNKTCICHTDLWLLHRS